MTVGWGLIGAGDIARKRVAPALRDAPSAAFVAVSRQRRELAEAFAREFNARRWYGEWREMIADPEVDAVYVATPVNLHASPTIAAAEAGKHVLCEKPMALDVRECDRMIDACRTNGVKLGVAYYRHFYPVVNRVKALVETGAIGTAVYAQINAFEWFDPPAGDSRRWLLDPDRSGGGPMFDFGCHRLEVLINCLGPVRHLTALVANALFDRRVEDTAVVTLEFTRGGCATVAVSHAAIEPRDTFAIFGSRGSLHIDNLNRGDLVIRNGGADRIEHHPPAANLHQPLIDDFVDAIRRGRDPGVDGAAGREVARLEEEIYRQ
jgi:predicted dehydrogenase